MRVFLIPLVAAGYAFALVTASTELLKSGPRPAQQPSAIVWADRVFSNRHQLAVWLRSRGSSYEAWASRYPAAARRIDALPKQRTLSPSAVGGRRLSAAPPPTRTRQPQVLLPVGILAGAIVGLFLLWLAARSRSTPLRSVARLRFDRARPMKAPHPRPGLVPVLATLMQKSVATSHRVRTELELRRAARDSEAVWLDQDYQGGFRARVHRNLPDLAMYATGALLAGVIGATVTLYLN